MEVILTAKTHKGKNSIREAGTDRWIAVKIQNVLCLDGRMGMLVRPMLDDVERKEWLGRWIETKDDPNFTWENEIRDSN